MSVKLYVGNLSSETSGDDLRKLFASIGTVTSCTIFEDRETGVPRGFGFVEMSSHAEAENAIAQLNGRRMNGRELKVSEAKLRLGRVKEDRTAAVPSGFGGAKSGYGSSRW